MAFVVRFGLVSLFDVSLSNRLKALRAASFERNPRRCLCLTQTRLVWFDEDVDGDVLKYGIVRREIPLSRIVSMEIRSHQEKDQRQGGLLMGLSTQGCDHGVEVPIDLGLGLYYTQLIDSWKTCREKSG
jgi:phage terminase large subunit-like protein